MIYRGGRTGLREWQIRVAHERALWRGYGAHCRDVGLFCGDIGLFSRDVPLTAKMTETMRDEIMRA